MHRNPPESGQLPPNPIYTLLIGMITVNSTNIFALQMATSMETILEERVSNELSAIDLSQTAPTDYSSSPRQTRDTRSESIKGDEKSMFIVKNLDTGESLDIRNENSAQFPETYTRVIGEDESELNVKEFL